MDATARGARRHQSGWPVARRTRTPPEEVPVMKRIVATLALVSALAFPGAAVADTTGGDVPVPGAAGSRDGMSIVIQSVRVSAKLVVQMQVAVTCQPRPASEYPVVSGW